MVLSVGLEDLLLRTADLDCGLRWSGSIDFVF